MDPNFGRFVFVLFSLSNYMVRICMMIMHLSMCRPTPPPSEGSGLYGGFDLTPGQIPPDGGRILCSNPPVNRGFLSPKQLHTSKQVIKAVFTTQSQVKSPSMGPTFQVKLESNSPVCPGGGGVVGQHIDTVNVLIIEPVKNNYFSRNNVPKKRPRLVL